MTHCNFLNGYGEGRQSQERVEGWGPGMGLFRWHLKAFRQLSAYALVGMREETLWFGDQSLKVRT